MNHCEHHEWLQIGSAADAVVKHAGLLAVTAIVTARTGQSLVIGYI